MFIELKNCNSIDYGKIEISENYLNVFYAINGTGKSTISKAIFSKDNFELMSKLKPFKYNKMDGDSFDPKIIGADSLETIEIFDENYVNQFVFKKDELIQNSFEIFVKTQDYERQLEQINELIKETKKLFYDNPELDTLIKDFTSFIDGFGSAKSGFSAAGAIGKALTKGNKIHNIPKGLEPYNNYLKNNAINAKWLKWHLSGKEFVDLDCQCPFCTVNVDEKSKSNIDKISEEFDPKSIEHLNKILEIISHLKDYFTEETNDKIAEITQNISGITKIQISYLLEIKEQVLNLKEKLQKIKNLNFDVLKDVGPVFNEISKYKIDLSYLGHLNSKYTESSIKEINVTLDVVINKANDLQKAVGIQNSIITKTIADYSKEINGFLKYAGYKYNILLENDEKEGYKLKLKHIDSDNLTIEANSHLSFGERNALALVLFMYQTIKANPDLIILDDPISSFDGNKKYAIIYKLFKEKKSFKGKTVVLFTHEFSTVIDTIYNMPTTIMAKARFLENRDGQLTQKAILKENISSSIMISKNNIERSGNKIHKLIYLRRLLEIEGNKGNAWNLISNVFKDNRDIPSMLLPNNEGTRDMKGVEILDATNYIKRFIPDFNYDVDYQAIHDGSEMAQLYWETTSSYEKLQLYRIINNSNNNNSVIKKFVNETFHVENDYLFHLNPKDFETVPYYVVAACDEDIIKLFPKHVVASIRSDCIERSNEIENSNFRKIRLFDMPASAGRGHFIDDIEFCEILIENTNCDYATKISGDSMEPEIPDQSVVLVKIDPNIKIGDTGIFNLNGSIYCKELGEAMLNSLNSNYPPIIIDEYDDFRPQGKVVKIIMPDCIDTEIEYL